MTPKELTGTDIIPVLLFCIYLRVRNMDTINMAINNTELTTVLMVP